MKTSPHRVLICGHQGRMGTLARETLAQHHEFDAMVGVGRDDDLAATVSACQPTLALELSDCQSVAANTFCLVEHQIPTVVGASGLQEDDIHRLRRMASQNQVGVLVVPNFSIGAHLMMHFAALAARWLPQAEIIEAHHMGKRDAPSGTALATAQRIAQGRQTQPAHWHGDNTQPGARGAQAHDVSIHALRLPGVLAQQSVVFGDDGETLTITHNTLDRGSFAAGILLACQRVSGLKGLQVGLDAFLFDQGTTHA